MKTSFSRNFSTAATILLLALTVLGASFQMLVKEFLTDTTISGLQNDAAIIADLASAYGVEGRLDNQAFVLNLDVASQISEADAVICDAKGRVLLCSDALEGCDHQGIWFNQEYVQKVIDAGGDVTTGVIRGLYPESRYVVAEPIVGRSGSNALGIVIVSMPVTATARIQSRISNIFLTAAVFVVLASVLAMSVVARRESRPLRDMAKAATAFGHGNLEARVKVEEGYSEEVEELALAFNNMASSLQKSEYQRQEFVANVSHELKTPMTTISGYVDGILDGTIPESRHRWAYGRAPGHRPGLISGGQHPDRHPPFFQHSAVNHNSSSSHVRGDYDLFRPAAVQSPAGYGKGRQGLRPRRFQRPSHYLRPQSPGGGGAGAGLQQHGLLFGKERISAQGVRCQRLP